MKFILAQVISVIVTIISLGSVQFRSTKIILISRIIANLLFSISCMLLGGLSGAWICFLAAFQTLGIYLAEKGQDDKIVKRKLWISGIFVTAYIVGTILTYQSWRDIVVCVCAMLFTLSIIQKDSGKMRTVTGYNMLLWIIYDLAIGAYAGVVNHGLTLISVITAKIRLDRK